MRKPTIYEIWKIEPTMDVLKLQTFDKKDLIDWCILNFPMYKVGIKTPLYRISQVIQPHYIIRRNGRDV